MEDIRLGRELAADAEIVAVSSVTPTFICGPDPTRTRLIVSADGLTRVVLAPTGIVVGTIKGLALTSGTPVQVFRVEDFGKLVQSAWTALAAGGTVNCLVVQCSLGKT